VRIVAAQALTVGVRLMRPRIRRRLLVTFHTNGWNGGGQQSGVVGTVGVMAGDAGVILSHRVVQVFFVESVDS
jgi:hypothetical protein